MSQSLDPSSSTGSAMKHFRGSGMGLREGEAFSQRTGMQGSEIGYNTY